MKRILQKLKDTNEANANNLPSSSSNQQSWIQSIELEYYEQEGQKLAQKVLDTFSNTKEKEQLLKNRKTYALPMHMPAAPDEHQSVEEQLRTLLIYDYIQCCQVFNQVHVETTATSTAAGRAVNSTDSSHQSPEQQDAWKQVLDQMLTRYYQENSNLTPSQHNHWVVNQCLWLLNQLSLKLVSWILWIEQKTGSKFLCYIFSELYW